MKFLFAALVATSQVFAQQSPPSGKTTEQQARSYVTSAFVTGAAPMVLSESVTVSPELRQRLGLAPEADSRAVYQALVALTAGKPVQVRRAAPDEVAKAQAPAAPDKPMFALESGDATLILQYDLERDNVAFIGLPGAVAVAAPVVAPAPPQKLPEVAAQPMQPAAPPPPAAEASKPAPVLQVVEPQVPRAVKPAAPAARPAPPAARAQAPASQPESRPPLRKTGACEIKPVMSDQDLVNCGATPR
ncbi:MAG TPA: hypothetical protein VGJ74_14305 [Burkholderiales bacterium]